MPDIVAMGGDNNYTEVEGAGMLLDLGDQDYIKDVQEAYIDMVYDVNKDKEETIYGVPFATNASGVIYNTEKFEELGLEVPKTVDELGEVAQKFKDAGLSPDYAIAGIDNGGRTYSNFLNSSNNGYGFDAVYQAFNATPGYFLKDDSGELYWGTTTDEMKEALTTLHDWYEKGLINPEVGTTTNGDNANNVKERNLRYLHGTMVEPWIRKPGFLP